MKRLPRITPYCYILLLPLFMAAGSRQAAKSVDEGLQQFNQGQFEQAAAAFEQAGETLPGDARIDFNRACTAAAAAAGGDAAASDRAVELFQKAAASTEPKLAAAARYCLGCLAAMKAKAALGEKPQDAAADARAAGLEHLDGAVAYYRDALKIDPQNEDARYNLETIRHWVGRMKELWRERDRQEKRDKMNLLDFVLLLEEEQNALRRQAKGFDKQLDTPLLREQIDEARKSQQELAREIEPLKEKIAAAFTQQQAPTQAMPGMPGGQQVTSAPAAPAMSPEEMQKAVALLSGLADQAASEMTTAADQLQAARAGDALAAQASAAEMLDQIYMAAVPYPDLVKRAVDTQRELVGGTSAALEPPKPSGADTQKPSEKTEVDKSLQTAENNAEEKPVYDAREEAWRQRFVTRWSEVMAAKAKQGLKQMPPPQPETPAKEESKAEQSKTDAPTTGAPKPDAAQTPAPDKPAAADKPTDSQPDPAEAAKKQMEGLRKSMELAVKLCPQVETLTDEAASLLEQKQLDPALPKQKEALRLLEEIAKPLQDQNQQQQQQDQQQQQQNQDNKDQKKQDQKNQDQQDKKDQQKQPQKKEADKDKDKKKEQDKAKAEPDKKQQKPQPQEQKQMSAKEKKSDEQKQAEAALRRARQRQQERREMEKAVEAELHGPATVEKDW